MIQKKLDKAAENYGQMKTDDKDMQLTFADNFKEGARWGHSQAEERILSKFGIHIVCVKNNHSEEMPWAWIVNKKQPGRWGGSATYYFPEKSGEAKTYDDASEQALQWTLENLI